MLPSEAGSETPGQRATTQFRLGENPYSTSFMAPASTSVADARRTRAVPGARIAPAPITRAPVTYACHGRVGARSLGTADPARSTVQPSRTASTAASVLEPAPSFA